MTTDTTFPKHCQMAEDEALKAFLETAIDDLAEHIYGDRFTGKLDHALTLAKETIEVFPHRDEPKALLTPGALVYPSALPRLQLQNDR